MFFEHADAKMRQMAELWVQKQNDSAEHDRTGGVYNAFKGGSFFFDQNGENSFTSTGRAFNTQETSLFNTGFRCAINAE
jgi:hypothetical protein